MGNVNGLGLGFGVFRSGWFGRDGVGVCVVEDARDVQGMEFGLLHQGSGGVGVYGEHFGAAYGGSRKVRLHTGEVPSCLSCPEGVYIYVRV